jgi:hypothetical protein
VISLEKKFVFVHIPRTGGTHLKKILEPYSYKALVPNGDKNDGSMIEFNEWAYHKHAAWYIEYLFNLGVPLDVIRSEYTFFTIVRNPWERALSHAMYENDGIFEREKFREELFNGTSGFAALWGGFYDVENYHHVVSRGVVDSHRKWPLSVMSFFALTAEYTYDYLNRSFYYKGTPWPDFKYIRYENYHKEIPMLLNQLGVDYELNDIKEKTTLATKHKHYSHYYQEDEVEYVRKICTPDLTQFGHTFEREIDANRGISIYDTLGEETKK